MMADDFVEMILNRNEASYYLNTLSMRDMEYSYDL